MALVTGLSPGAKLRENRIFSLTPTGVEFAGELHFEQWREGMATLRMFKDAGMVWLADFMAKGRQVFGDERVAEVLSQLEFPELAAEEASAIASLPRGLRHEKLTTEHYWVIAQAKLTTDEQIRWAKVTIDNALSPRLLKQSIEQGKVLTNASGESSKAGVATIHGFRQIFDRWFSRVDQNDPIGKWDDQRKRDLWKELEAPTRVGIQLAASLGISLQDN